MQKVLIVDDDQQVGLCLQKLIPWRELDMELAGIAYNGNDGFQMTLERSPDIIISDLVMPGMDGVEFCKRVTSSMPDVSFILLSGYEDFAAARQAIRYHAIDYILKPIDRVKIDYITDLLRSVSQKSQKIDFYLRILHDRGLGQEIVSAVRGSQSAYLSELFRKLTADSSLLTRESDCVRSVCVQLTHLYFEALGPSARSQQRHERLIEQLTASHFTMDMLLLTSDLYLNDIPASPAKPYHQLLCDQVRGYIDKNYANPDLSLSLIADTFSYSPDYLGRMFMRATGDTVLTCITNVRIAQALRLLAESSLALSAIAKEVGYANPNHLSHLIRKNTGMTPQQYRAWIIQGKEAR